MKSADLTEGVDYAHRTSKYAGTKRVTVIETRVPIRGRNGSTASGVRVRHTDGREVVVGSREIDCTWAAWEQREADGLARREAREAAKSAQNAERAALAVQIEDVLARHGFAAERHGVGDFRVSLLAAGLSPVDGAPGSVYARFDVQSLMHRGVVSIAVTRVLLADAVRPTAGA